MSRILLVDDQKEVLDGLQAFLTESMEDVEIVRASDGASGYELALQMQPDVIIVDVMMPRINGLEMISLLRKDGIRSRIIVLTAYERFDYAHQAISLKVDDYLIKPVTRRQIYQAVIRQLSVEAHGRNYDLYSNVLLQEYLSGADIFLQKDAVLAMSGLNELEHDGWMLALYELDTVQTPEKLAQMLVRLEREFSSTDYSIHLYHTYGRSLFAVVNCEAEYVQECAELLKRLSRERVIARCGCSEFGTGLDRLCELYAQAETALEQARNEKECFVVYRASGEHVGQEQMKQLTDMLAAGNEEAAQQIAEDMIREQLHGGASLERVRTQISAMVREISGALGLVGSEESVQVMETAGSMLAVRREVRLWIDRAAAAKPDQAYPLVVGMTMEYIRAHCDQPLTVAYLANRANLSYAYFSSLFAQSTGMTVKRFILVERLKQAERMLLEDVAVRVGDIARKCGFDDVRYFSTCFRKEFGETPQRYREIHAEITKP